MGFCGGMMIDDFSITFASCMVSWLSFFR